MTFLRDTLVWASAYRIKVAIAWVSKSVAELSHCSSTVALKLSCSRSFEHQVEYDTELSHFALVIITVSVKECSFAF